jgi:hypothetical protein
VPRINSLLEERMERTRRRNDKDMMCLNTRWKLPINIYRMEICIQEGPIISLIIIVIYDPSHCDEIEKEIPYKQTKWIYCYSVTGVFLFHIVSSTPLLFGIYNML